MKKSIICLSGICLIAVFALSCSNTQENATTEESATTTEQVAEVWECPMKCEGKTYTEAGKCSVCGMDLVKVEKQ
ncbi:MAG: hypothetical protein HYY40_05255 [Bacteroidetes bacterium]|nr:hypothetical protein [Bacteroidota bacterium]